MSTKPINGESFFYYFSGTLLITVIIAFGANIFFKNYHLTSSLALIITHGLAMLLWYILLFWQTRLIQTNNIGIHKKLGMMSIGLALIIIISGIMVAIINYQDEGEALTIMGNFSGMLNFLILYTFSIVNRFKSDSHKRLMILAGITMLSPALVRILRLFEINDFVTLPFWLLFMVVLPVYDFKKLKRIHKATLLGTGLILLTLVINIAVGMSKTWENLMNSIFGNS